MSHTNIFIKALNGSRAMFIIVIMSLTSPNCTTSVIQEQQLSFFNDRIQPPDFERVRGNSLMVNDPWVTIRVTQDTYPNQKVVQPQTTNHTQPQPVINHKYKYETTHSSIDIPTPQYNTTHYNHVITTTATAATTTPTEGLPTHLLFRLLHAQILCLAPLLLSPRTRLGDGITGR